MSSISCTPVKKFEKHNVLSENAKILPGVFHRSGNFASNH